MEVARKGVGAVLVMVGDDGRVLLMRRSYPPYDWVLPGGMSEADESPTETVVREVREELGVEVEPERLIGVYYQLDHFTGEFLHFVFRATLSEDQELRADASEVAEMGFFTTDALPEPMSESTRRRITDGVRGVHLPLPVTLPLRAGS